MLLSARPNSCRLQVLSWCPAIQWLTELVSWLATSEFSKTSLCDMSGHWFEPLLMALEKQWGTPKCTVPLADGSRGSEFKPWPPTPQSSSLFTHTLWAAMTDQVSGSLDRVLGSWLHPDQAQQLQTPGELTSSVCLQIRITDLKRSTPPHSSPMYKLPWCW